MYWFPMAALTNYHKLIGLKQHKFTLISVQFCSVQSLCHVGLFSTPWFAAHQASLSIINSWSLLRLMSIELVMPFNYLILCYPLLFLASIFPSIRVLSNESVFLHQVAKVLVSALASALPMNSQDWFPLGWTGWISLQSKGLKTLLQHHSSKASILRCSAFNYWKKHSLD